MTSECSIDGKAWERCGFWKRYDNLRAGNHRFSVRRKRADGSYTTPTTHDWTVDRATPQPETQALCYQRGNQNPNRGFVYWTASNSLPSTFTMTNGSGRTGSNLNLIDGLPGIRGVEDHVTQFPPGLISPFPMAAQLNLSPSWALTQNSGGHTISRLPTLYAPCFRILPPPFVVDNGDGTSSATFAWVNHNGFTVQSPHGARFSGLWTISGSPPRLTMTPTGPGGGNTFFVDGSIASSQNQPVAFPASASGSWTHTWQNSSPPILLSWSATNSTAGMIVRDTPVCAKSTTGQAPSILQMLDCPPSGTAPSANTQPPYVVTVPAAPAKSATLVPEPGSKGQATTVRFTAPSAKQPPLHETGGAPGGAARLKVTGRVLGKHKNVRIGDTIRLRSLARNIGTRDAINLRICDRVPKGMKLVESPGLRTRNGRTYCWRSARLGAGSGVLGEIVLRATSRVTPGRKINRVTLTAASGKRSTVTTSFRVLPAPRGLCSTSRADRRVGGHVSFC